MPDDRTEPQNEPNPGPHRARPTPAARPDEVTLHDPRPQNRPHGTESTAPQTDAGQREALALSQRGFNVPGYKAIRQLGQGTYGVVWLAQEEATGIRVAVKFLTHKAGEDWRMLQGEVRQLAALHDDPGIVALLDAGLDANPPYYVMRYCEGGSLARRLEGGPLTVAEALPLFRQVCEALAYIHVKGIRHCDLKPGNILLDARGKPLIADFGQAHLSDDSSPALGTFFYMAPEQADLARQIPDARWDVYALGALLYAMLTGRPPREDSTLHRELKNTTRLSHRLKVYRERIGLAPRPREHRKVRGIDRDLVTLIDRCLELDPNKRPRDAGDVLQRLARRERRRRQRPLLVAAVLAPLALVLLMGGLIAAIFVNAERDFKNQDAKYAAQVRDRNTHIAELVATDVRLRIAKRTAALRRLAENREFADRVAALPRPTIKPQEERQLDQLIVAGIRIDDLPAGPRGQQADPGWDSLSLINPDGYIVSLATADGAAVPHSLREKPYRYRDWFHGQGEMPESYEGKMLERPYISEPYTSTLPGNPLMVTLVTPVRDKGGKAVALLSMSLEVKRIDEWFGKLHLNHTFAVLINRKGQYLFHPDKDKVRPHAVGKVPPPLAMELPAEMRSALARGESGSYAEAFPDPVRRDRLYEASYAPVGNALVEVPWGVVVQTAVGYESPGLAELRDTLWAAGALALTVVGVVLPLLWAWVLHALRKQEGLAHG
jgi:hypothetical protein